MIRLFRNNRVLIAAMVGRSLKARFAGTMMGMLWAIFLPLAQACIYTFVFSVIMHAKSEGAYQQVPFPIWLLTGLLPWTMFAEALGLAARAITGNVHLVKKTMFDKKVLPLCSVLTSLVNHGFALIILLAVMLFYGLRPGWSILFLPLVSFVMFLFILAWAYIVAAFNVFLRDIDQLLGVVLNIGFFATPIVYSATLAPSAFRFIFKMNPFFYFVNFYREIILLNKLPDIFTLFMLTSGILLFFAIAVRQFEALAPEFADSL